MRRVASAGNAMTASILKRDIVHASQKSAANAFVNVRAMRAMYLYYGSDGLSYTGIRKPLLQAVLRAVSFLDECQYTHVFLTLPPSPPSSLRLVREPESEIPHDGQTHQSDQFHHVDSHACECARHED